MITETYLEIELRKVQKEDAEFTYDIRRSQEDGSKFPSFEVSFSEHLDWIDKNQERDTFFVIIKKKSQTKIGTISLYNFQHDQAEWGRWIVHGNAKESMASMFLVLSLGFEKLNLRQVYSKTYTSNSKVLSLHRRISGTWVKEEFEGDFVKHTITESMWPMVKQRLLLILKRDSNA